MFHFSTKAGKSPHSLARFEGRQAGGVPSHLGQGQTFDLMRATTLGRVVCFTPSVPLMLKSSTNTQYVWLNVWASCSQPSCHTELTITNANVFCVVMNPGDDILSKLPSFQGFWLILKMSRFYIMDQVLKFFKLLKSSECPPLLLYWAAGKAIVLIHSYTFIPLNCSCRRTIFFKEPLFSLWKSSWAIIKMLIGLESESAQECCRF